MIKSPKNVSSIATTAERGWAKTPLSQLCWNKGNRPSIWLNCRCNADEDMPTCVSIRMSLKNRDNLSAPTWHSMPKLYRTATIKTFSQASPALVSHRADSGCRLRRFCAFWCLWTLLLDRLINAANLRRLFLPRLTTSVISERFVARISSVVLFFCSLAHDTGSGNERLVLSRLKWVAPKKLMYPVFAHWLLQWVP